MLHELLHHTAYEPPINTEDTDGSTTNKATKEQEQVAIIKEVDEEETSSADVVSESVKQEGEKDITDSEHRDGKTEPMASTAAMSEPIAELAGRIGALDCEKTTTTFNDTEHGYTLSDSATNHVASNPLEAPYSKFGFKFWLSNQTELCS